MTYKTFEEFWEDNPIHLERITKSHVLVMFREFAEATWNAAVESQREARESEEAWITWSGGELPVDADTLVDVKFRDDVQSDGFSAGGWSWYHELKNSDIIAYRLSK